jgi:methanogenic corrinoid protein MtbC1
MKLATRGPISAAWSDEILEPSSRFMDDLRRHPNLAPATLVELVPLLVNKTFPVDQTHPVPLRRSTAAVLRDVILSAVIPTLADGRPVTEAGAHGLAVHPRVRELAELLIAPDQTAARELIEELHAAEGTVWPLYTALFEPAARDLGNLWSEDLCSEFDVTLGLSRMQSAARLFSARSQPKSFRPSQGAAVLIVPEPGEFHHLGAALDSEVLWNAGWAPRCEYPANDKALQDLLSATWFDALDVSLSAAFRRGHWLPRMKQTIAEARRASRNPALLVIVGGRVFMEHSASGFQVGADLTSRTALNVDDLILHGLAERDGDLRRA